MTSRFFLLAVLLPMMCLAAPPLWDRNLGNVGMGKQTFLLSNDASTIYTLWSCNSWSNRPSYFLLALEVETGALQWNGTLFGAYTLGMECSLSQDAERVYVTSIYTGTVVALRKSDGAQQWHAVPFQNGYSINTYSVLPLKPGYLIATNPQTVVVLNATSGVTINVTEPNVMPFNSPTVVPSSSDSTLVFIRSSCYEFMSNLSAKLLWTVGAPSSYPSFLAANSQIAVYADLIGQGVPRLNATDVATGAVLWSYSTYNTQSGYTWGAIINGTDALVTFGSQLQYFNATGGLVWELDNSNSTGTPTLDPTGEYVGLPQQIGTSFAIVIVHVRSGAITHTQTIVDGFTMWYQSAQPFFASGVVGASISSNQQTSPESFDILTAQSFNARPPIGVVVHHFSTVDCSGHYDVNVLPAGCVSEGDDFVTRTCASSGVSISSGPSCAQQGNTESFSIGQCVQGVDGAFIVASCSSE